LRLKSTAESAENREDTMKLRGIVTLTAMCLAQIASAQENVSYASYGGAYQEGVRKAILELLPKEQNMKVTEYVLSGGIRDIRTKVRAKAIEIDVA